MSGAFTRAFMLLAPAGSCLDGFSDQITRSSRLHTELIAKMQHHRGKVYLDDCAVAQSDLIEGRHVSPLDSDSWHLLTLGGAGTILGCIRFRPYPNSIPAEELAVSRSPITRSDVWGERFLASLNAELDFAREAGLSIAEVGGWALDPAVRGTAEALKTALAIYALAQIQGGTLIVSTATKRNNSAGILRRLGGRSFQWMGTEIPEYYDASYGCEMEVLRFDSRFPNPRYIPMILDLRSLFTRVPTVCPGEENSCWPALLDTLFGGPALPLDNPVVAN